MAGEDIEFAINILKCAEYDKKACKITYKKRLYSLSTYHLQQAIEKTTKSFMISTGRFKEKDIKNWSHNSLKAHVALIDSLSDFFPIITQAFPGMVTDTSDVNEIADDKYLSPIQQELAQLKYETIRNMINLALKTQKTYENPEVIQRIREMTNSTQGLSEEIKKGMIFFQLPLLYTLSAISFVHSNCTRYPNYIVKPWDYTKRMGIVKATPLILKNLTTIMDDLEKDLIK